jgi:DNA-3-methyladenine glycosylase II
MTHSGLSVLNLENLAIGLDYLSSVDPDLARLHAGLGPPPLWDREPGFPTLVHIILEQQVSLASARAAFQKLQEAAGILTPGKFLEFEPDELKKIGFSRQKAAYCRELAQVILNHELDLDNLSLLDDSSARSALLKIKGIGPWTADIYLLMVLLRPDSWPSGDLALAVAIQELKDYPTRPTPEELEHLSRPWRPWRAVAARLLWFSYLRKRGLA